MLSEQRAQDISVTAIVQEAEVSRQVFYEHFPDRDAVIFAAGKQVFTRPYEAFADAVAGSGGIVADPQFGDHVADLFGEVGERETLVHNLMSSPVRGELTRFVVEIMEDPIIVDLDHRFVDERKAAQTARFLAAGMQGVFNLALEEELPPEEVGKRLEEVRSTLLSRLEASEDGS